MKMFGEQGDELTLWYSHLLWMNLRFMQCRFGTVSFKVTAFQDAPAP